MEMLLFSAPWEMPQVPTCKPMLCRVPTEDWVCRMGPRHGDEHLLMLHIVVQILGFKWTCFTMDQGEFDTITVSCLMELVQLSIAYLFSAYYNYLQALR